MCRLVSKIKHKQRLKIQQKKKKKSKVCFPNMCNSSRQQQQGGQFHPMRWWSTTLTTGPERYTMAGWWRGWNSRQKFRRLGGKLAKHMWTVKHATWVFKCLFWYLFVGVAWVFFFFCLVLNFFNVLTRKCRSDVLKRWENGSTCLTTLDFSFFYYFRKRITIPQHRGLPGSVIYQIL